MTAAIVISCILAYALLGTIGGAVVRSFLEIDYFDEESLFGTLGFIFWPLVLIAGLLLGPYMLIRSAQRYLTPVFRKSSIITAIKEMLA